MLTLSIMIGFGVAMDASAVAMANGMAERRARPRKALYIALVFGLFRDNAGIRLLFRRAFSALFKISLNIYPFVAFSPRRPDALPGFDYRGRRVFPTGWKGNDSAAGPGDGIDALFVGLALAFVGAGIFRTALVIVIVTFILSFVSVYLGCFCGSVLEDKARALGGIILLALAARVLAKGFK